MTTGSEEETTDKGQQLPIDSIGDGECSPTDGVILSGMTHRPSSPRGRRSGDHRRNDPRPTPQLPDETTPSGMTLLY